MGEAANSDENDRKRVAAVDRALDILLAFRSDETSVSLAQLADRTGFYKSTILRLLHTLELRGFIERLHDGTFRVGAPFLRLGMIYQRSFRLDEIVPPQLVLLAERSDESASFFVKTGKTRHCLFRVDSTQPVRHHVEVGATLSPDVGTTGKLLSMFAAGVERTSADRLQQLPLTKIGANPLDISVITAPVFGVHGALVGAVCVSGPTSRFKAEAIERISTAVMDAVQVITRKLGGDPAVFQRKPPPKARRA